MEFSDIALVKFSQVAPDLAPMIVNFTELTNEEAEGGAVKVGVFILRTGVGMVLVPVVSRADAVFPIDSVYIDEQKKFKPLTLATISYLSSSAQGSLGKAVKRPQTFSGNPDLTNLISPPRTGKFTYASASRLTEFLAVLPTDLKKFAFEKISSERSTYEALDKMFGLKAIFTALNGEHGGTGAINSTGTGTAPFPRTTFSVITTPREVAALMSDYLSRSFLAQNYVVTGGSDTTRSAVAYQPYKETGKFTRVSPATDAGREFNVVRKNGSSVTAFLPKYHNIATHKTADSMISILEDGNYVRGGLITHGEPLDGLHVMDMLFKVRPPKLLRDLERDETFLLFTSGGEALGPFTAQSVTRTINGVEISTNYCSTRQIFGYNNYTKEVTVVANNLIVPHNIIVFSLGEDVTSSMQTSVNDAADMKELVTSQYLGAELDLRHDGVEFTVNSVPVGGFPQAMKVLVEKEEIHPDAAENFLKQASEVKYLKLFLSKKAATTDVNPTEFPQYGNTIASPREVGLSGSFMPAVNDAKNIDDAQAVESTIIGQLLQAPELNPYIEEYLPEIDETVDKLGRILLLSRMKIDQLAETLDSDAVFGLVARIKAVYRQLGDTSLKLSSLVSTSNTFNAEANSKRA